MPRVSRAVAAFAFVLSLTTGATALYAADQGGTQDTTKQGAGQKAEEKVVATVNGQPITERDLDTFAQNSGGHRGSAPDRKAMLNQLVTRELLYQKAVQSGFDKDPNIQAAIKQETHNMLANVVITQLIQGRHPSDNELKAAYRKRIKTMGNTEYRASHILVKTKAEAEKVIQQLNNGADFAKLAKAKSTGPSGRQGGDLGWFSPDNMVKPFAEATAKLKVGSYTKEPVHTQFGWHVIKLVNTRKVDPPSFEDMKGQLMNRWQNNMIKAYIERLRSRATIKIKD